MNRKDKKKRWMLDAGCWMLVEAFSVSLLRYIATLANSLYKYE